MITIFVWNDGTRNNIGGCRRSTITGRTGRWIAITITTSTYDDFIRIAINIIIVASNSLATTTTTTFGRTVIDDVITATASIIHSKNTITTTTTTHDISFH